MPDYDTTSALHRQNKKRAFNLFKYNPELQTLEDVFLDCSSTPDAMALAVQEFMLAYQHDAVSKQEQGGHVPDSSRGSTSNISRCERTFLVPVQSWQ